MRLYTCSRCKNIVYFENTVCLGCSSILGFDSRSLDIISLSETSNPGIYVPYDGKDNHYRFCANHAYGTCNWLVAADEERSLCDACSLNRVIPFLSGDNVERWKQIEVAKHRLVYSLLRMGLSVKPKAGDSVNGIAFDFLADVSPEKRVMTGHNNGVITLNIEEADEAKRVSNKLNLGERYRTLLGHFRHEVGHHYWNVLVSNTPFHKGFRNLFGDESIDYDSALKRYYSSGPSQQWSENFISPYATSHPWEDWAETWAHYMHLMDTLETAYHFGVAIHPEIGRGAKTQVRQDPYTIPDFNSIFETWLPLSFALTSLNRSMGYEDFYPFIIAPKVVEKLTFIHSLLKAPRRA